MYIKILLCFFMISFSILTSSLSMNLWEQTVKNVDGQNIKIEDKCGEKATVLFFWCNHCPYVKKYEDRMISIANDYSGKGVGFLALNPNDAIQYPGDSFEKMQEIATQKQYPFAYAVDDSARIAAYLNATKTPHIYVYDSAKNLLYVGAIDDNVEDPSAVKKHYLREVLDALLNNKPLPYSESKAVGCTIKWPQ